MSLNGTNVSASDLNTLNTKTSIDIDASGINEITGSYSELNTLYSSGGITGLGNEELSVNGAPSSSDINNLIGQTSGTITLSGGNNDTLNLGAVDSNLDLGAGNDTVTMDFSNLTSADSIDFGSGGNDTLNLNGGGVINDLDFSNISNLDTLNLSSSNDTITLGSNTAAAIEGNNDSINGNAGDDTFNLDFSNIGNFSIDGGSDTTGDKVVLTGSVSNVTSDTEFAPAASFENIEELDITGLNSGSGFASDNTNEFIFTSSMLDNWIGSNSGSFKLTLTAAQAEDITFTDQGGQVHDTTDAGLSNISSTSYSLDADTTLVIDIQ